MKTILCALAATGALAVQDTSPPVITLSLAAKHAFDQDCTAHSCPQKNAGGYKSVTCEVDSTAPGLRAGGAGGSRTGFLKRAKRGAH
jgi:hypothetical protein